jgi:ribosomal protein S12 methylthiotransferase
VLTDRCGVYLHTLGCPKNEADSGTLGRRLSRAGVPLAAEPEEASHIVVNTCGFIEAAREESIESILEAGAGYPAARLLVMGCLVERYRDELEAGLPEVAGWYGLSEVDSLVCLLATEARPTKRAPGGAHRTSAQAPQTFSYIKVSDGCDHLCSFCAIPAIKGPYAALGLQAVVEQAQSALELGARELILVGQDTAIWRSDRLDLLGLVDLLAEDARVDRLRLLYLQPENVTERLLTFMATHDTLCRYLDIPFQHASRSVLRRMARAGNGDSYLELIWRARQEMPDVSLRSTFIVGFPGETENDVDELLQFVAEAGFDHAGVFAYSPEEGTRAASLPGQVAPEVVAERVRRVGQALIDSGEAAAAGRVGTHVRVLLESLSSDEGPEGTWGAGRTCGQAPEIDGVTFLTGPVPPGAQVGGLVDGVVEEAAGYDLLVHASATRGAH